MSKPGWHEHLQGLSTMQFAGCTLVMSCMRIKLSHVSAIAAWCGRYALRFVFHCCGKGSQVSLVSHGPCRNIAFSEALLVTCTCTPTRLLHGCCVEVSPHHCRLVLQARVLHGTLDRVLGSQLHEAHLFRLSSNHECMRAAGYAVVHLLRLFTSVTMNCLVELLVPLTCF